MSLNTKLINVLVNCKNGRMRLLGQISLFKKVVCSSNGSDICIAAAVY